MSDPLHFEAMTKRYGAVTVLDDVSITLAPGRVHALMGENGAGKSTLIKLIAGVLPADAMTVRKGGSICQLSSPADAAALGFRFIHQELNVVSQLSVAENILLSHRVPERFGLFVDWVAMARRAGEALHRLGVHHIDPRAHAGALGTGDQMLVKLASALVADEAVPPLLYVLDEPTAALKDAEVAKLFEVVRSLKDAGAAILYVSHRISEITTICDDVTVLRNGRHISTHAVIDTGRARIIKDMTGKDVDADERAFNASGASSGRKTGVVAQLERVGARRLSGIDLTLREGEVVGVAGLSDAGQTALLQLFLGLERTTFGTAQFLDGPLPQSPQAAWARGVAYVPQERRTEGLMMAMGVRPNALLPHLDGVFAKLRQERRLVRSLAEDVSLKAEGPEQPVWQLSGGNQQKVLFARALAGQPKLLLLDEPTRGVDVAARFEIYSLIKERVGQGCACLVASSDLQELLTLSDRILILHGGHHGGILDTAALTTETLLTMLYQHESLSR